MPIQGNNSELTHNDVAAFALDFIRVDPRLVAENPRGLPGGSHRASEGQTALAPAAGQVVAVVDSRSNDQSSAAGRALSNFVCLEHETNEVSCLLHLQAGAETHEGANVEAGQALARVGRSGVPTVHLHFALSNLPESKSADVDPHLVTIPAAFSDYFASTDFGRSWQHVERGTPAPGEWVMRRPHR
jgi:murein DD-endopeptidase MepM/ murein hydrolase activator NlpD